MWLSPQVPSHHPSAVISGHPSHSHSLFSSPLRRAHGDHCPGHHRQVCRLSLLLLLLRLLCRALPHHHQVRFRPALWLPSHRASPLMGAQVVAPHHKGWWWQWWHKNPAVPTDVLGPWEWGRRGGTTWPPWLPYTPVACPLSRAALTWLRRAAQMRAALLCGT